MDEEIKKALKAEIITENSLIEKKIAYFIRSYRIRYGQEIADEAKTVLTEAVYYYYAWEDMYSQLSVLDMVLAVKHMYQRKIAAANRSNYDDDEAEFDLMLRIVCSPMLASDFPGIDPASPRISEIREHGSEIIQELMKYKPHYILSA